MSHLPKSLWSEENRQVSCPSADNAAQVTVFGSYIEKLASFRLGALLIMVRDRKRLLPEWRVPWSLWLFVPALLFVSFAGRCTDDETWDLVRGSVMATHPVFGNTEMLEVETLSAPCWSAYP